MIYIVHGEDTAKSRSQILNQQKKLGVQNKQEIDLSELTLNEFKIHLTSNSLFGDTEFLVFDITKIKAEELYIELLNKKNKDTVVILYAEKTLPKTNTFLKNADKLNAKVIENNNVPQENIFKFVDCLFSKNRIETYKEYEKLVKADVDSFYIMSMIYYGLRNIAKCINKSPSFDKSSPYTKNKVISQAKKFTRDSVKNIYSEFYTLEKNMKLGEKDTNIVVTMAIENVLNSK